VIHAEQLPWQLLAPIEVLLREVGGDPLGQVVARGDRLVTAARAIDQHIAIGLGEERDRVERTEVLAWPRRRPHPVEVGLELIVLPAAPVLG
jgi:hypothetical protein